MSAKYRRLLRAHGRQERRHQEPAKPVHLHETERDNSAGEAMGAYLQSSLDQYRNLTGNHTFHADHHGADGTMGGYVAALQKALHQAKESKGRKA